MSSPAQARIAIVTGAAQGIGQAIATRLAERGHKLVLVDLRESAETAALIGAPSLGIVADISVETEWKRIADTVDAHFGRADIIINNAGIFPRRTIDELDIDTWRRTFAVNVDAHFYSAKHIVPLMQRNKWGRFISIASNSIGYPITGYSHYMASKMAAIGFVRGLANDLGADGITVNAVLPAPTATPSTTTDTKTFDPMIYANQSIKRMSMPEDIAGPVAFLTSDDAGFITGQALVVDGGAYKIS